MERNPILELPIEDRPKAFDPVKRYRVVVTGVVSARSLEQAMDKWREYTGYRGILSADDGKVQGFSSAVRELK